MHVFNAVVVYCACADHIALSLSFQTANGMQFPSTVLRYVVPPSFVLWCVYRWDDDRRWPTFDVCVTTNPFSIRMLSDQHFVILLRNYIMQRVFIIPAFLSCVFAIVIPVNSSYTTSASFKCGLSVCIIFNAYFLFRKHGRQ